MTSYQTKIRYHSLLSFKPSPFDFMILGDMGGINQDILNPRVFSKGSTHGKSSEIIQGSL